MLKGRKMRHTSGFITTALVFIIIAACMAPGSASSGYYWSKSGYLYTSQSATYEIRVDCAAQLIMNTPYGSKFDIYALRRPTGSWPSEGSIKSNYDKADFSYNHIKYLNLEQGNWYILVYAHSGFGAFKLDASNTCFSPLPPLPDPCYGIPDCGGIKCTPEAVDYKTGYLNAGESKTYVYQIMGNRNYIEWILSGPCGEKVIPMAVMTSNQVNIMRTSYCGSDFTLYIYKDCDPRYYYCKATKADISTGANKYVGIPYPTTGSRYYAQVYAKSGSGTYSLNARSYNCHDDIIVMMSQQPEMVSMMSTASDISAPASIFAKN